MKGIMAGIQFANPEYFYLLLIIPLMIAWYIFRLEKKAPSIKVSTFAGFGQSKTTFRQVARHSLFVLRVIGVGLLITALARPQSSSEKKSVTTEGIDIVIALDVSTSMLAEDFKPNRLGAAIKTAMEFVDSRPDDRIGLVVFAGESYTQCPVTIDHDILKNLFASIKPGVITDGTAIGMGLSTAVSRLKDSKAKSKVIILLSDGENNAGFIAPETASDIAKTFGIRVYTIGVGSRGKAPYPFDTPFGKQYRNIDVKIDEALLKSIAGNTNGQYFRATNNKTLEQIYKKIDKLEKTKIDVAYFSKHTEKFLPWAIAAALLLLLEILLRNTVFRSLP